MTEIKQRVDDFGSLPEKHEIDIRLLKKDVAVIDNRLNESESRIKKLEDISHQLAQLIQLHEQRIASDKVSAEEKFNTVLAEIKDQSKEIRELERDIRAHINLSNQKVDEVSRANLNKIDGVSKSMNERMTKLDEKINKVQSFQLKIMGGIIVLAFLVEVWPLLKHLLWLP